MRTRRARRFRFLDDAARPHGLLCERIGWRVDATRVLARIAVNELPHRARAVTDAIDVADTLHSFLRIDRGKVVEVALLRPFGDAVERGRVPREAGTVAASSVARTERPSGPRSRYSFLNTRSKSSRANHVCHAGTTGWPPNCGARRVSASGVGASTFATVCHAACRRAAIDTLSSSSRAASETSAAYGATAPMILRSCTVAALVAEPSLHISVLSGMLSPQAASSATTAAVRTRPALHTFVAKAEPAASARLTVVLTNKVVYCIKHP